MDENRKRISIYQVIRWVGTILAFGLVAYLLYQQGWEQIWDAVRQIGWARFAIAIGLMAVSRLMMAGRWYVLMHSSEENFTIRDGLRITFAGLFANNFLLPDIPVSRELKRTPEESHGLFLSDLHIGSTNFLEKEFEKLGSNKVIKVDVRFIAASNRDLRQLMGTGGFREDLFYRLSVFPIKLPPLRERRSDIPLLVNHFLELNAKKSGKPSKRFSKNALKRLVAYDWPGNVRELQNLVERSFAISKEAVIRLKDISLMSVSQERDHSMTLREAVGDFEKSFISEVLERVNGNRKRTAEILGIHRNTLLAKMNEYGLK